MGSKLRFKVFCWVGFMAICLVQSPSFAMDLSQIEPSKNVVDSTGGKDSLSGHFEASESMLMNVGRALEGKESDFRFDGFFVRSSFSACFDVEVKERAIQLGHVLDEKKGARLPLNFADESARRAVYAEPIRQAKILNLLVNRPHPGNAGIPCEIFRDNYKKKIMNFLDGYKTMDEIGRSLESPESRLPVVKPKNLRNVK